MADAGLLKQSGKTPDQYFNVDYIAPDAMIVLNRGTRFEQDITTDMISSSTSNSIDSIAGSFNVTIDNTNDKYADRFGYYKIKKMSSIEIFVKSQQGAKADPNDVDVINIPAVHNSISVENLGQVISMYFGSSTDQRPEIEKNIIKLNNDRVASEDSYVIDKVTVLQTAEYAVKSIVVSGNTITINYTVASGKEKTIISDCSIVSNTQASISFTTKNTSKAQEVTFITKSKTATPYSIKPNDFTLTSVDKERMDTIRSAPLKIPRPSNLYQRIFQGIILNVVDNVSPGGQLTLTLSGQSNGYWLDATVVNIFPGGFEETFNNINLSVYSNRYADTHAMDIFKDLIRFSTDDITKIVDFNLGNIGTSEQMLELNGRMDVGPVDAYGNPLQGPGLKWGSTSAWSQLNELKQREDNFYSGKTFAGTTTTDKTWLGLASKYDTQSKKLAEKNIKLKKLVDDTNATSNTISAADRLKFNKSSAREIELAKAEIVKIGDSIDAIKAEIDKLPPVKVDKQGVEKSRKNLDNTAAKLLSAGKNKLLEQFRIIDHWKTIFARNILEVVDNNNFLNLVYPFKWDTRSPEASMDGDYVSKANLAKTISENLMYEFYMDTNGHFVLKPPFYNIGIDSNDKTYIISDDDVVSFSVNDTAEGMITRVGVAGDYAQAANVSLEKPMIYNIFQDFNLIRDYGFHATEVSNRLFLHSFADCRDFGKAYLSKNNMQLFNASVTIIGRPTLRLGTSVYFLPRDTIYYITGISHQISAGGEFQTTLTLIGGRRIVTGFTAETNVSLNITKEVNTGTKQNPVYEKEVQSSEKQAIKHYVLTSSLDQESLSNNQFLASQQAFSYEQSLDESQIAVASAAGLDTSTQAALDKLNESAPKILRNVYQITAHVNPALIGLIVDQSNEAISAINKANYDYIISLGLDSSSVPRSITELNTPPDVSPKAFEEIRRTFTAYVVANEITAETFTISDKESFILKFLKDIQVRLDVDNKGNSQEQNNSDSNKIVLSAASKMFNAVINKLDNEGIYRQYTDFEGRELPAYLNFGKSLLIENNTLSVDQFASLSNSKKQQSQRDEAESKRKGKLASNIHIDGTDDTSDIITAFNAQLKISGPVKSLAGTKGAFDINI